MSTEFPLIDVVIPSIGRRSLEASLRSVFKQTCLPKKVIVVDDSESQFLDAGKFPFPIEIVKTGGRKGPSYSRNTGINYSDSEWVALLDDDDYWLPEHLFLMVKSAYEAGADMAVSSAQVGRLVRPKKLMNSEVNPLVQLYKRPTVLRSRHYFPTPGMLVKRKVFENIQFRSEMLEREDLMFLSDAFRANFHIFQSSHATVIIKPHGLKSLRRTSLEADLNWCKRLNEVEKGLGYKFLLGIGLRNSLLKAVPLGIIKKQSKVSEVN